MRRILTSLAVLAVAGLGGSALAEDYVIEGVLEEGDQVAVDSLTRPYIDSYTVGLSQADEVRFFLEMEDAKPHLSIHDESGALVEMNMGGGVEPIMQWDWKAPATGTYFVVVTTAYKMRQAYRLTISDLPPGTVQEYTRQ